MQLLWRHPQVRIGMLSPMCHHHVFWQPHERLILPLLVHFFPHGLRRQLPPVLLGSRRHQELMLGHIRLLSVLLRGCHHLLLLIVIGGLELFGVCSLMLGESGKEELLLGFEL